MSLGREGAGTTSCPLRSRWNLEVRVEHHCESHWRCGPWTQPRCRHCIWDEHRDPRDVQELLNLTHFGGP